MSSWPALFSALINEQDIENSQHVHSGEDITGPFGDAEFNGDIWSYSWDGGFDLSAGLDAVATAGYFLDSSAGRAQFQQIYAKTGTITGTFTLNGSGTFETKPGWAVGAPGAGIAAIVITATPSDRIYFYSGAGAGETVAAYMRTWPIVGVPHLDIMGPSDGVNVAGELDLYPGQGWLYGGNKAGLGSTAAGGGTVVMTIDGGAPVFRPNVADATIDLGSPTMAWLDSYVETMYSDRGDGTYVEAAPRGTLLKYGFDGSGINRAIQGGGADAEIIVTEGGSAITVACEYVGQLVVVDVTIMVSVSGLTAGEWWRMVPWINGAAATGWVAQYNEALSSAGSIAALVHAAGAAPGLGHSSTGAHDHDVTGRPVYNTSGPASAGTAHTHTAGNYNTALVANLTSSDGNHTGHGTHTIADHAAVTGHTHATTYDGTWTGRWVGQATADASKEVILSIGGCTETTDATLNQHSLAYMIWRL